jgi:serine/threonine protein kinase/formylglycine-generating enzyme required for sulfatase activity
MSFESLPSTVRYELDDVCDAFEEAWRAGRRPRIEEYLGGWKEPERCVLLEMLLGVEVELRRNAGDRPEPREYLERFAAYAELIRTVCDDPGPAEETGWGSPPPTEPGPDPVPPVHQAVTVPATTVAGPPGQPSGPEDPAHHVLPARIGRYPVIKYLGCGNFEVYLARDDHYGRDVAIKIARPDDPLGRRRLMSLAEEAEKLKALDHPRIVKLYEYVPGGGAGAEADGFIVLEYIAGQTLEEPFRTGPPPALRVTKIVALVADAVHHAHTHRTGVVHRDLKPSNILLDLQGEPHVCDFGLALDEEVQRLRRGEVAGTLPYMAPEQVRGETQRLDGRTDIWALGVILYRGLTGKLPFPGRDQDEIFEEILHRDPKPLRMHDPGIEPELERICLRCLSRSMAERYLTAADLAADLNGVIDEPPPPRVAAADSIVPKGLRPFDVEDARFFLALLPGPRRGDGLPESVRFWKDRVEALEGDKAFSVGLLYGLSGGGKSSFVHAGLLPNLDRGRVRCVALEATPTGTEARLLAELRRVAPLLPPDANLPDAVAILRDDRAARPAAKVLVVLDQFEQWLQAHPDEPEAELIRALRHCDGRRVQALVLVRDDFWMAVTRFFRAVDVPLVQGGNSAAVELFDARHARKVLEGFGRALGQLAGDGVPGKSEAALFLDEAVDGLTGPDDRVIPVRLSLFAEVVRHRSWTPATLHALGGVDGIGVKFLEDCFESAPYKRHRSAAQAVLKELLPPPASVIRGAPRTGGQLRVASGYADQPGDFAELVRVLDSELRLVTPTDPHGSSATAPGLAPRPSESVGQTYYQLAHDYLVRPIRQWLEREQRSTHKGRAQLRLALITASWLERPGPRRLPSPLEWAGIRWHITAGEWSADERRLIRATTRHYLKRGAAAAALLVALAVGGQAIRDREVASSRLQQAVLADYGKLPALIPGLDPYRALVIRDLEAYERDGRTPDHDRVVAGVLLYRFAPTPARGDFLREHLLAASEPDELELLRSALVAEPRHAGTAALWQVVFDEGAEPGRRLRAAAALAQLAQLEPKDQRWAAAGRIAARALLGEDRRTIPRWIELLGPVVPELVPKLDQDVRDPKLNPSARAASAEVLAEARVRRGAAAAFAEPIAEAPPDAFNVLVRALERLGRPAGAIEALNAIVAGSATEPRDEEQRAGRRANAAVALLALGHPEPVWPRLRHADDPRLRSLLIDRLGRLDVNPLPLLDHLHPEIDPVELQGVLLALAEIKALDETRLDRVPPHAVNKLVDAARDLYRKHPHPGVHSAAELLLRRWGKEKDMLAQCDKELREEPRRPDGRRWELGPNGHTLVILPGPLKFRMGSPKDEEGRLDFETQHDCRIDRSLAVATKEVTIEQYRAFNKEYPQDLRYTRELTCPVNSGDWYAAVAYCNWLSKEAGIDPSQWCYPAKIGPGMVVEEKAVERYGYRLPTEAEWEYLCRAGTETARPFGSSEELFPRYGWTWLNSNDRTHTVGRLLPNEFGLFDMLGNVWEWCHDGPVHYTVRVDHLKDDKDSMNQRFLRGGAFDYSPAQARSAYRYSERATKVEGTMGFRVVRTLPPLGK